MDTTDFECTYCGATGEAGVTRYCHRCRGTGRHLCDLCLAAPAVDVIERGRWELGDDDASQWVADPRAPGVALCERCLTDASHAAPTMPCPPPSGMLVQCDDEAMAQLDAGVANDSPMTALLLESSEVAEDARAAGMEPFEAYRVVRRSAANRRNA